MFPASPDVCQLSPSSMLGTPQKPADLAVRKAFADFLWWCLTWDPEPVGAQPCLSLRKVHRVPQMVGSPILPFSFQTYPPSLESVCMSRRRELAPGPGESLSEKRRRCLCGWTRFKSERGPIFSSPKTSSDFWVANGP